MASSLHLRIDVSSSIVSLCIQSGFDSIGIWWIWLCEAPQALRCEPSVASASSSSVSSALWVLLCEFCKFASTSSASPVRWIPPMHWACLAVSWPTRMVEEKPNLDFFFFKFQICSPANLVTWSYLIAAIAFDNQHRLSNTTARCFASSSFSLILEPKWRSASYLHSPTAES